MLRDGEQQGKLQGITQEAELRVPPGEGAGGPAAAELQP